MCFSFGLDNLPPIDRDEPRFMQATKQMLETDNYTDIYFQEEPRYKKPIGIYWLQAISVKLFSPDTLNAAIAYRIPSLLGGLIAIIAGYALTRRLFRKDAAIIAAILMPLPLLLTYESHIAKTDAVLLATITICFYVLAKCWYAFEYDKKNMIKLHHIALFWGALAIGTLVKGINLAIIFVAIISLSIVAKNIKWFLQLKPLLGIPFFLIIAAPWFWLISQKAGNEFVMQSVQNDFWNKIISVQESHGGFPGYYILTHFITFFPLSLLTPFVVVWSWKNKQDWAVKFCLASIIPTWIIMEFIPTKLPHYILPFFPLMVALCAKYLSEFNHKQFEIKKLTFLLTTLPFSLVTASLIAAIFILSLHYNLDGLSFWVLITIPLVAIYCLLIFALKKQLPYATTILMLSFSILFYPVVYAHILPNANYFNISGRLLEVKNNLKCNNISITGFDEPSAIFLLGTNTKLLPVNQAAELFFHNNECQITIIEQKYLKQFEQSYQDIVNMSHSQKVLYLHKIILGQNLGNGKKVQLYVYYHL
jgi:4-amino-4-deoxy-L-arabinose transferase-like glycosyltransferase